MFYQFFNKNNKNYSYVVFQGHRGIRCIINKNTSIIGTFTSKSIYYGIPLLPTSYSHECEYMKFNIVNHKENYRFQQNNKVDNQSRLYQLNRFNFYYNLSYFKHIPVWTYNEHSWHSFKYQRLANMYTIPLDSE